MLDYETCKKLKELGFKQYIYLDWILPNGEVCGINNMDLDEMEGAVKVPGLSELIETFGDKFRWLARAVDDNEVWVAQMQDTLNGDSLTLGKQGEGESPIEAVANLYLALNDSHERN